MELRIAPELYLKQLIIGGFEKVYEIGKVFRNEGIDATHNPEFTTIEFYEAYSDYNKMMDKTERLIKRISTEMFGSLKIAVPKKEIKSIKEESHVDHDILEIDFSQPFQKFDVMTELENYFGEKINLADSELRIKLEGMLAEGFPKKYAEGMNEKQLLDKLIEGAIESKCIQPSYIMNHPSLMSPLAKCHPDNELISERFELFIDHMEIVNAYSEQNDWALQKASFEKQQQLKNTSEKDHEIMSADDDYIEAMSYGMPPTGG